MIDDIEFGTQISPKKLGTLSPHRRAVGQSQSQSERSLPPILPSSSNQSSGVQLSPSENLPKDASFSDFPLRVSCPICNAEGVTRVEYQNGTASWVWCVLCFFMTGVCFFFPFCVDSMKDKIHYCLYCGGIVGKKKAQVC